VSPSVNSKLRSSAQATDREPDTACMGLHSEVKPQGPKLSEHPRPPSPPSCIALLLGRMSRSFQLVWCYSVEASWRLQVDKLGPGFQTTSRVFSTTSEVHLGVTAALRTSKWIHKVSSPLLDLVRQPADYQCSSMLGLLRQHLGVALGTDTKISMGTFILYQPVVPRS